jgi:hemerythrin
LNEKLRVGVPSLDSEHRILAAQVDAIERVSSRGDASPHELQDLLQRLVEEAAEHFAAEQDLMRATGYPDREAHAREHDRLLQHVSALLSSHASGRAPITLFTARSLREWLEQHIEGSDRALGEYLLRRS